ncbi:MAG TPA: hypothetical protein VLD63_12355 [Anaerolineales bacterium]|nr:hypothetical protein [Anaerolineales bacterium]
MAGQVVQMDYPVIQNVAKGFRGTAQVMQGIGKASEMTFAALEAVAVFPGLVAYYRMCKENVAKKTKELTDTLEEFAGDLDQAVQDHKNGDSEGKSYFGKG